MNNHVIRRLAASAALALVAAAGQAQVFSTSPFAPIPDTGTAGTIASTIDVAGASSITDLNVIIDITHTFDGDLDIILVPPSNDRYIHLTSDNGGLGDNYTFTRFDQASSLLISAGIAPAVAPFNGTFAPEGGDVAWRVDATIPLPGFSLFGLDDFIGTDPNGTWTLIIDDDAGGDIGTLNYWSLEFNGAVDPSGPAFGVPPTATGAANPSAAINDGTGTSTFTVTVTPGTAPDSTFIASGSVTVDGSPIGLSTITLLDDGVFPDQVAGDFVFTADVSVPNGAAPAQYALPFTVVDDQARNAFGNINFTVTAPPPDCAPGLATLSFAGVQSNGPIGDGGNSVVTGDFGLGGNINQLAITGRFTSIPASYRSEARIHITAPSGNVYDVGPFAGAPASSGQWDILGDIASIGVEPGSGTWTFEFWESFNDGVNPDAIYDGICFSADLAASNPTATDTVTPGTVARDGMSSVTLSVTVSPGAVPPSTGLSVTVDDSPIGGSGSLALLDDGVFPDAVAGDSVFTATTTVPYFTAVGAVALPYTVLDAEGRSFADTFNFTVTDAVGACCTPGGCMVTNIADCIDVQGGTFAGNATSCFNALPMTTDGAGAFEDISFSGSIVDFGADNDDGEVLVSLPFTFSYWGADKVDVWVGTNGYLSFDGFGDDYTNDDIPTAATPNDSIYVLWDDLDLNDVQSVTMQTLGTPGVDQRFIVQWTNVGQYNAGLAPTDASTFQVALFEDGSFEFRYQTVSPEAGTAGVGDTTTIGFEDPTGTNAVVVPETRDSLSVAGAISYRGNSMGQDTGVCGGGSSCPACAADYDQNGGVDGADIGAFFADFEAGATCADVDQNGGVDGGDIGAFFVLFEAGGC